MNELNIPDLTFHMVKYGERETPWDLRPLLYRGGAGAKANLVATQILKGDLGAPILDRIPLVKKLHEYIEGKIVGGGRRSTAKANIRQLRCFFAWIDHSERSVTLESVEKIFIEWSEHLIHRQRVVGEMSELQVYNIAAVVTKILDDVLERRVGLLSHTRIRHPKILRPMLGIQADKQNLEQTFAFGHALLDITDSLNVEVIHGSLPILIRFRSGKVVEEWLGLKPPELLKTLNEKVKPAHRLKTLERRAAKEADKSFRTRHSLVNLRIEAEMLIFIAQTGMNLAQAHMLKMSKFRYQSHLDGYKIYRVYKGRRQGEVAFEIYSQYRKMFERYLAWRAEMFPEDDEGLLFPLVKYGRMELLPVFHMVQKICRKLDVQFIPPRTLRKTRINWLLRYSKDLALTAEMHAHTQETLLRHYEQPNLQLAMVEISRFHARYDPAIASPGPGLCIEVVPRAMPDIPLEATSPDCISPAGCLFCEHQRDIDSEDHVWSLASYRHLKSLELARYRPPATGVLSHPAAAVIDRVTAKIKYFEKSSEVRRLWVREALARVEEDHYHPSWDGFIRLMGGRV